jgi:hypothetical protein
MEVIEIDHNTWDGTFFPQFDDSVEFGIKSPIGNVKGSFQPISLIRDIRSIAHE